MFAQEVNYMEELENNNDFMIRQKPYTEGLLSNYLKSANIKEDTIYAILYAPADCFRCEAGIPAFYNLLKKNNRNNKMLLISAYADSIASSRYNEKNDFKADYFLYDTKSDYKNIFSFNTIVMYGLQILKICPKSGVLITGGHYSVLNKDFVSQLVAHKERLAPHTYTADVEEYEETEKYTADKSAQKYSWKTEEIPLEMDSDMYISSVYDIPKLENGCFFFNDMLNNGIMFFRQDGKRYVCKALLQVNDDEKNRFIEVPEESLKHLQARGMVFYISLAANMIDDKHLAISYSLPKIMYDKNVNDKDAYALFNSPAILIRDIDSFQPGEMITPDFNLLGQSEYFYQHYNFDIFDNRLWLGCEKLTWPMDGFEKEDLVGNVEMDSFDDTFYDTFNPIIASFDMASGECNGHFGRLEESQRKSKTGYYFHNIIYTHDNDSFLYGNGYTGKLYVSKGSNVGNDDRCYDVFNFDESLFAKPDSTMFYKSEYGTMYNSDFNRCITEVKMNKKEICCLLKYGRPKTDEFQTARYSYVTINRKTGKMRERMLPDVDSSVKCMGYGIRNEHNKFNPFVFIKDKTGYKVLSFR